MNGATEGAEAARDGNRHAGLNRHRPVARSSIRSAMPGCLFRGSRARVGLEANHNEFWVFANALDLDDPGRLNQIGKARKAVVARVEVGGLFRQMGANAAEIGAAVFVGRGRDSLGEHIERRAIQTCFRRRGFCGRRLRRGGGFRFLSFAGRIEHVEIYKLVAGGNEETGRLAFPKPIDRDALFTDSGSEASKVTVALETMQKPEKRPV
jgi:hypothetical protein